MVLMIKCEVLAGMDQKGSKEPSLEMHGSHLMWNL
jgi:hypothetical protein